MTDTTFPGLARKGTAAARPAASAVAVGTIYSATDTGAITQSDGSTWSAWATITAGSVATDAIFDTKGDLPVGTGADTAAKIAAAANGASLITASGESTGLKWRLNNDGAAAAPTVNEDSGDGYAIGSRWLDTTNDKEYVALDVTVGAAVWKETTATGGAGLTHAYEGYNTVGGSTEAMVGHTIYSKTFTPGQNEMLLGISAHMKWQADYAWNFWVGLYDNNAGTPGKLLAVNRVGYATGSGTGINGVDLHQTVEVERWLHIPLAAWLTSGTVYYVAIATVVNDGGSTYPLIYYDTSGSDDVATRTNAIAIEGFAPTWTDSTKKYSIRADVIY